MCPNASGARGKEVEIKLESQKICAVFPGVNSSRLRGWYRTVRDPGEFHDRASQEETRAKILEEEYEDLLEEIHRDKDGSSVLPQDGLKADSE